MNKETNDPNLGYEYAAPDSRLARFIDEQHRLLERARLEIQHLKEELRLIEDESKYWKEECEKADAKVRKLSKSNG